ncbi:MAG TPA: type II secretion system F family protein [Vicinamibacterales bacterium]|nr:type II secretion system F family protein [Vicinamibacterales bacterium]
MLLAAIVFLVVTAIVAAVAFGVLRLPGSLAARRLEKRLSEVSNRTEDDDKPASFIRSHAAGPLPALDRAFGRTGALAMLIEQSGTKTSPSSVVLASVALAAAAAIASLLFIRQPFAWAIAALVGAAVPTFWLKYKRSARLKRFEEQFPEALDLLSRAIRAGHAFQTAMGMCADELPAPVGVEFKKSFDQQNFGLPLKEALNELSERVPILDVRFFVTAVTIQRETGGNLAEILDNLAHVVRERFKILRQVRVHTAHGRFTGYVLLSLPAALAVALSYINPGHMDLLFKEHMGQMMILTAIVMQTIGYVWIRKVIKIEV